MTAPIKRRQFAARIWSKLVSFDKAHRLLERHDRVLAAVSGGPDSVCLAHFLAQMARRKGFSLALIHVHHGLRGRSADKDLALVERLGRLLGLEVIVARIDVRAQASARGRGLEEAGRKARYAAIRRASRKLDCNKASTGHHLDDQAETVLLNLLRGTRLSALGGIPPARPLAPGLSLIRPLLCLSRSEIIAYLKRHQLPYRMDASNRSLRFTRNWIRWRVLPELERGQPRIREHLAGIASQVRHSLTRPDSI
ncbi:MAG: tRNA lysidine(34) synthetase TilS [Elusimicrobia bacterium]|nr:tRNA lysidine(34) synthetase TilS [Elusimicrobiota bacterium]